MPTDKDRVRPWIGRQIKRHEITNDRLNAWRTKPAAIPLDNPRTGLTPFEGRNPQMGKLCFRLYRD